VIAALPQLFGYGDRSLTASPDVGRTLYLCKGIAARQTVRLLSMQASAIRRCATLNDRTGCSGPAICLIVSSSVANENRMGSCCIRLTSLDTPILTDRLGANMIHRATSHFGQCALCREERVLRDSHLMPKWVYRRLRRATGNDGSPVFVSRGAAVQTSRQVTKHLLCDDCENRFGTREDYVAGMTEVDSGGKIKLAHHVSRQDSPSGRLVSISSTVETDQITYFAASIIWRACVMGHGCRLGRYEADFRSYLLGEAEFPSVAAISMAILETPETNLIKPVYWTTLPTSKRAGGYGCTDS